MAIKNEVFNRMKRMVVKDHYLDKKQKLEMLKGIRKIKKAFQEKGLLESEVEK